MNDEERREYGRKQYQKNKVKLKEYSRKQYQKNKAELKEYGRKRYQKNKVKLRECGNVKSKEYYKKNKDECLQNSKNRRAKSKEINPNYDKEKYKKRDKCKLKQYQEENKIKYVMCRVKRNNTKRGVTTDYDVLRQTLIEMLKTEYCTCCGIKFDSSIRNKRQSVDRVDNDAGYIIQNIQIICYGCNAIKRHATVVDIEAIYHYMMKYSPSLNRIE